jgi:type II secretory pathway component PulK
MSGSGTNVSGQKMKTITKITKYKNEVMTAEARRKDKGLVIIAVLWMVVVLMVMTAILGRKSRLDMKVSLARVDAVRCKWACRAGIEKAIAVLNEDKTETDNDSSQDKWNNNPGDFNDVALNQCSFTVQVIDESSKLNINTATKEQLLGLRDMTEDIADAIIDWRDSDDTPNGLGVESGYYESLPYGYMAHNGPFRTIRELLLVKDVTEQLFYGEDTNLNGRLDYNERDGMASPPADNGDNVLDVGWAAYLTCYPFDTNESGGQQTSGGQTQPSGSQQQSSGSQQQSSGYQQQSSGGQQQSSGSQQQSSGSQQQSSGSQQQSSGSQQQTSGGQQQSSQNQGQTSSNQSRSSSNQGQSSGSSGQSSGHSGQGTGNSGQSSGKQGQSSANQGQSSANQGQSSVNQGQSSGNQGQSSGYSGQSSGNQGQNSGNTQQASGNSGQGSGGTGQSSGTSQTTTKININTASDIVLTALLGGGDEAERNAQAIVAYRDSLSAGVENTSELTENGIISNDVYQQIQNYITTSSNIFMIRCYATTDRNGIKGTTLETEAVVDRSSKPARILYWYQETNN